jgi:predicted  nucleic acid-binding Zn-ribbon protein
MISLRIPLRRMLNSIQYRQIRFSVKQRKSLIVLLLSIVFILHTSIVRAQEGGQQGGTQTPATPTPKTPEQEALEKEISVLKLQKERAELLKDIRSAQAVPSITALEGKSTLNDKVEIEVHFMAYKAMTDVAFQISKEIKTELNRRVSPKKVDSIVIYNEKDVKDLRFYNTLHPVFKLQLDSIKNEYQPVLKELEELLTKPKDPKNSLETLGVVPKVLEGFFAGSSLLKGFIDVMSFFRTDTEISGVAVTIDDKALVAEVMRALLVEFEKNVVVYNPAILPPQVLKSSPTLTLLRETFELRMKSQGMIKTLEQIASRIKQNKEGIKELEENLTKLEEILKKKSAGFEENQKSIAQLQQKLRRTFPRPAREKLQKQIDALKKTNQELQKSIEQLTEDKQDLEDKKANAETRVKRLEGLVEASGVALARLKVLNEQFDAFIGDFLKIDAATGQNALTLFVKSENLEKAMDGNSYWLELKSVKAGGNNRTRRNLIRYLTGAKIDHSGGFIVGYAVYDKAGSVMIADKLAIYPGYKEPKAIEKIPDR